MTEVVAGLITAKETVEFRVESRPGYAEYCPGRPAALKARNYAVAFHRYTDREGHPTDMWAGLRYVDRFERRDGEWRIRKRVCAYEWRRTDRVEGEGGFAAAYVRGRRSTDDIVYPILSD